MICSTRMLMLNLDLKVCRELCNHVRSCFISIYELHVYCVLSPREIWLLCSVIFFLLHLTLCYCLGFFAILDMFMEIHMMALHCIEFMPFVGLYPRGLYSNRGNVTQPRREFIV